MTITTQQVWKRRLVGFALALAILAADQYVKWLVRVQLDLRSRPEGLYELLPFFDLRWTQNFGISLGMFEATSVEMRWALVLGTALIAVVVGIWMLREKTLGDIIGLGLIFGGALGNIYDRYTWGYVIDYADLHFGEFRPFLIFNIADAAITIGVLIILARSFLVPEKKTTTSEPDKSAEVPAES
ncbi:signal peptidase II [Erythrobacter litoralis]|uniref:Lipoprotein signal peptidase n=1 Tax=Erythrobacter litoralis (strain HTCC2594) TaxID=314225 RepID=Q2N690_ERYLH|nr:signal peptidase II [Erythrobacter litoralis]ABC64801.1 lipoprotein signal peptidase [Erythrobacter litoralis HTCC2594]